MLKIPKKRPFDCCITHIYNGFKWRSFLFYAKRKTKLATRAKLDMTQGVDPVHLALKPVLHGSLVSVY